jgi:hypothetical protein
MALEIGHGSVVVVVMVVILSGVVMRSGEPHLPYSRKSTAVSVMLRRRAGRT